MIRGLFGRLLVVMCGVATASTALVLLLQERSLSRDLEQAAQRRLAASAKAADRLVDGHLQAMAERYHAVSGTPQSTTVPPSPITRSRCCRATARLGSPSSMPTDTSPAAPGTPPWMRSPWVGTPGR